MGFEGVGFEGVGFEGLGFRVTQGADFGRAGSFVVSGSHMYVNQNYTKRLGTATTL